MEKLIATTIFESLSSGIRLDTYRLLVRQGHTGMVAGEIATELGLPASNMSFHLKAMTQAKILTVEQEGRYMRYRADLAIMQDLIAYLTEACCDGQPKQCFPASSLPCVNDDKSLAGDMPTESLP
ncbi:helix-turn-helix transcriptional regulator [uncultured Deefgea sp.]|uniref:ArsR/SmtB family transcription factor n=1 Tax=uncultured Deefgea sp. TaxID=1304914 RepID=UPI0026237229|nr:metalloregulator ArsR/SmtB family transcription factor [uncultured Deefgea sp.]